MPGAGGDDRNKAMRIEVLYVPGCPNYEPAVERIRKVLVSESVQVGIRAVSVNTEGEAKALLFPGSPTVRINGEDVEGTGTTVPSLSCRLYADRSGIPSEESLRLAVTRAKSAEQHG
jgi:hypothetical protein